MNIINCSNTDSIANVENSSSSINSAESSDIFSSSDTEDSSDLSSSSDSIESSTVSSSSSIGNPPSSSSEEPECTADSDSDTYYTHAITCSDEFEQLQGVPLTKIYGGVKSVKVIFDIAHDTVYFADTKEYRLHYDFSKEVLNYSKSHSDFNAEQYSNNPQRLYYLGVLNLYSDIDIYTLEFAARDDIRAENIQEFYEMIHRNIFFKEQFYFMPVSNRAIEIAQDLEGVIPMIDRDAIYADQIYQPLHLSQSYGYLRRKDAAAAENEFHNVHDILLTNGVPNNISVVAGIITTTFQTPLSHINVLSQNRDTPNMALKSGWEDSTLLALEGTLVYFEVKADTFILKEAMLADAEEFWEQHKPNAELKVTANDTVSGLQNLTELDHYSTDIVGAKAANFAELSRLTTEDIGVIRTPESAFAIPFYYYQQHLESNGITPYLTELLNDSEFNSNIEVREQKLETLQNLIKNAPINEELLALIRTKVIESGAFRAMRFRSSTNAEDLKGFNGAGLYTSKTGIVDDPAKPVDEAIKKVWASLWKLRAYEEREYFGIDQSSVRMGILVHRSFPDELANGVAITKNLYNSGLPAFTINVQLGEESIVDPDPTIIADLFTYYTYQADAFTSPTIEYITHSTVSNGEPVLTDDEILTLAQHLKTIKDHFYGIYSKEESLNYSGFGMDVEFKIDTEARLLYIKQARPY